MYVIHFVVIARITITVYRIISFSLPIIIGYDDFIHFKFENLNF